jgi:hypothetical protein
VEMISLPITARTIGARNSAAPPFKSQRQHAENHRQRANQDRPLAAPAPLQSTPPAAASPPQPDESIYNPIAGERQIRGEHVELSASPEHPL